ncbi:hypothetical protein HAX54_002905 [Datura stramonium]|uniref:Uncharacterized protein n=1 Tax=Datura stramonium TaxID=4076 RepID=A0ABS8WRP5_DATST|nr:hypothetical protein [Datura stramonium]
MLGELKSLRVYAGLPRNHTAPTPLPSLSAQGCFIFPVVASMFGTTSPFIPHEPISYTQKSKEETKFDIAKWIWEKKDAFAVEKQAKRRKGLSSGCIPNCQNIYPCDGLSDFIPGDLVGCLIFLCFLSDFFPVRMFISMVPWRPIV